MSKGNKNFLLVFFLVMIGNINCRYEWQISPPVFRREAVWCYNGIGSRIYCYHSVDACLQQERINSEQITNPCHTVNF